MSLVAYEGSSDDDSSNEVEDMDTSENITSHKAVSSNVITGKSLSSSSTIVENFYGKGFSRYDVNNESDSAEDDTIDNHITTKLKLDEILPKPKKVGGENEMDNSVDVEIGPIPPKKLYGDEDKHVPPPKVSSFENLKSKKVQGIVKISIPSLKDFDDEEESATKRIFHPSKKGSGLFAVLPPPRNSGVSLMTMANELGSNSKNPNPSRNEINNEMSKSGPILNSNPAPVKMHKSLVPDSVKQNLMGKRPAPSKLEEIRAKYLKKDANVRIVHSGKPSTSAKGKNSDDSDDDDNCDFFSLDSSSELINDPAVLEKLQLPTPSFEPTATTSNSVDRSQDLQDDTYTDTQTSTSSTQEDVMQFVKKRKKGESINFIEVKADDLRPDSTEWLKNITDESQVPARRSKGLGGLVKRKHQITYLAFEAKAREQELQNTWAQNRASRRQTQSKYGF